MKRRKDSEVRAKKKIKEKWWTGKQKYDEKKRKFVKKNNENGKDKRKMMIRKTKLW